jgi:accessory colonization factor AcfC
MNERIKLLAREAGLLAHNPDGPPTKLEKFAELIVKECAKLVEENMDPQNAWITPRYIKKHFGVEE